MSYDRSNVVRKALLLLSLAALLGLSGCFKHNPEVTQTPLSIIMSAANQGPVGIGQSTTFTAYVYDQNGQGVQWSASPLNFGTFSNQKFDPSTLTATVTYTAPSVVANPTKVTITATSITNPDISASFSFQLAPVTVSLQYSLKLFGLPSPMAPLTLNPGEQRYLTSRVSNDVSNLGVKYSLSPATGGSFAPGLDQFTMFYTAPAVSAVTKVIITATSVKYPSVSASQQVTILPSCVPAATCQMAGPNVVVLNVDGGPVPGHVYPNRAYTSIMLCNPGSYTICQTVDGILVDTGSYGLRILQSAIPLLQLPAVTDQFGNTLENCAAWPDGSFLWGTVSMADIYIGEEAAQGGLARNPVVQVISSTPTVVPAGCSNGTTASDNTPELLGANGILGIGPEITDCTVVGVNYCDGSTQSTPPNVYYACPSTGCTTADSPVLVNSSLQVSNPISSFGTDYNGANNNNGAIIQFPAVSDPQPSVTGTLTFGIATESNNGLGTATVLTLDNNGNFATTLNGPNGQLLLTNSFIDSGSDALRFPDSLPACTVNPGFYCPTSPVTYSAQNQGKTQGQSTVNFTVEDADGLLFAFGQDSVFPKLAGPSQGHGSCLQPSVLCVFDWGLPFFYGRKVYLAIDGEPASPPSPWWAY
jgi:hypothetical protein